MKKVLALVLAFVMVAGMATVAFAADPAAKVQINVGEAYSISSKGVISGGKTVPGSTIYIGITDGREALEKSTATLGARKITIVETLEGSKLVDSVKVVEKKITQAHSGALEYEANKTYYFVEIKTKDNKLLDETQKLAIELRLNATKPGVASSDEDVVFYLDMAYGTAIISELFGIGNAKVVVAAEDETSSEWTNVDMFLGDSDAHFVTKMYKQPDFYIGVNEDVDDKYIELYEDAALSALNVTMPKSFKQAGTLYIPAAMNDDEKAPFLYEEKDGKLVEVKGAYDKENEEFVLKNVKALGKYLISDVALEVKGGSTDEANPETGANDVVAIAAGLAVISLVAAGAVSLKK